MISQGETDNLLREEQELVDVIYRHHSRNGESEEVLVNVGNKEYSQWNRENSLNGLSQA